MTKRRCIYERRDYIRNVLPLQILGITNELPFYCMNYVEILVMIIISTLSNDTGCHALIA